MDPNLPQTPSRDSKSLLILILVLGLVGAVMATVFIRSTFFTPVDEETVTEQEEELASLAEDIIIYGVWQGQRSVIKAYNLRTGNTTALARLSEDSKKVTILSSEKLLYIKDTDARDHGKELVIYAFGNKKNTSIYKADEGFGIDDYVVSPDGKYIAVWEVRFAENSGVLRNGSSRVYTAEVGKNNKNRIYDEVQVGEAPIHYPRAITDSGEVFLDSFLPNNGAGWAYGMTVSNFSGSQKQTLTNMQNGTYGTQPVLSPDGLYLAFAGYDTLYGSGTELIDGFRRALIRSNTIELLDIATKERIKLQGLSSINIYSNVSWDTMSGKLIYTTIARNQGESGTYSYDLSSNLPEQLNLGEISENKPVYVLTSYLSNGNLLVGTLESSDSAFGNLGDTYGAAYTSLSVLTKEQALSREENPDMKPITLRDGMVQMIKIVPQGFFPSSDNNGKSIEIAAAGNANNKNKAKSEDADNCNSGEGNIQFCLFRLKPELAKDRKNQQSKRDEGKDGRRDGGRDGAGNGGQNNGINGPGLSSNQSQSGSGGGTDNSQCDRTAVSKCSQMYGQNNSLYKNCYANQSVSDKSKDPCTDSPLYLYGDEGKKVSVTVNAPIYNSNATYNNSYEVTLLSQNKIHIDGEVFDSIKYDYTPGIKKFIRPTYGDIVSEKDLSSVLLIYAAKLGLNQKETADLVSYAKEKITAPFIFISFFNQKTSEQLLPISFIPYPDNYLNVVFYFKQFSIKPSFSLVSPIFKPFTNRSGFTAVEISTIVE